MAKICSVICTSHSPYLHLTPSEWTQARQERALPGVFAPDVPEDTQRQNEEKHERCMRALAKLSNILNASRPDVAIIFGDDQKEQFNFNNFPALGVYTGAKFEGYKFSPYPGVPLPNVTRSRLPRTDDNWKSVQAHPQLAEAILVGLMDRGFDPAFCAGLADEEEGIGHAFMRPLAYMRPAYDLPTVPIFLNCFYGPQPTGKRCYQLGRAVAEIIKAYPSDVRVAVIGSGGLWHTPLNPGAAIDPEFDATILKGMAEGEIARTAAYFDGRRPQFDPSDKRARMLASGGTGIVSGLGSGTGETRNWIAASATVDGRPGTIVDYVEINASPVGVAFAYWEMDGN